LQQQQEQWKQWQPSVSPNPTTSIPTASRNPTMTSNALDTSKSSIDNSTSEEEEDDNNDGDDDNDGGNKKEAEGAAAERKRNETTTRMNEKVRYNKYF